MTAVGFEDAYSNGAHDICKVFFPQCESNAKNWNSLELLLGSDDRTFWTVIAAHPKITVVVDQLVKAVDESHATSSGRRVLPEQENLLIAFLLRFMTTLPRTSSLSGQRISPTSVALRFAHILPSSLLFPVSLVLLRRSGQLASTALAAFLLQSPVALTHFTGVVSMWYDSVTQIAARCIVEAKRGRYQRRAGDVLPLVERSYRLTKHMWAVCNAAPYMVDYMDRKKAMLGLRVLLDVISPLLQHFTMTCDALSGKRPLIVRANAMLVNAAVQAATLMLLFGGMKCSISEAGGRSRVASRPLHAEAVALFEDCCGSYIVQHCQGTPHALLSRNKKLFDIFHEVHSPHAANGDSPSLTEVLSWVADPIPNSVDFNAGIIESCERMELCIVEELNNQGFTVDILMSKGFLSIGEAQRFGYSAKHSTGSTADTLRNAVAPPPPASSDPLETGDPEIDMVRGVLPHLSVHVVQRALEYFHHDIEQLINEAVCGNLPPHLLAEVASDETTDAHPHAAAVHSDVNAVPCYSHDIANEGDMERFVSSDYADVGGADNAEDDEDDSGMLATLHPFSSTMSETLYVDEGFREHTFEFMYDDERDDAEDGDGGHTWGAVGETDDAEDTLLQLRPLNEKGLQVSSGKREVPATESGSQRPSGKKAGAHVDFPHGMKPTGKPAYAAKKVSKLVKKGDSSGGAKTAINRAVKKGHME